mmetsp:Transcript_47142/g.85020  ORF Transcript_47142/g.85020 Transcript_47142/m.85020 type:complete len:233 (+) Transcript_47142:744-1442(+)
MFLSSMNFSHLVGGLSFGMGFCLGSLKTSSVGKTTAVPSGRIFRGKEKSLFTRSWTESRLYAARSVFRGSGEMSKADMFLRSYWRLSSLDAVAGKTGSLSSASLAALALAALASTTGLAAVLTPGLAAAVAAGLAAALAPGLAAGVAARGLAGVAARGLAGVAARGLAAADLAAGLPSGLAAGLPADLVPGLAAIAALGLPAGLAPEEDDGEASIPLAKGESAGRKTLLRQT